MLEAMYVDKSNFNPTMEIFESLFSIKQRVISSISFCEDGDVPRITTISTIEDYHAYNRELTYRIREVIENMWTHIKTITKLTNLEK